MLTELVLDGLVAALLAVTVGYCFVLNRRLTLLRSGQDGLLEVVRSLNVATEQARVGVRELHETGETVGSELSDKVASARAMIDELSLIVESGNNLADRLADDVSNRRAAGNEHLGSDSLFRKQLEDEPAISRVLQSAAVPDADSGDTTSQLRQALKAVR